MGKNIISALQSMPGFRSLKGATEEQVLKAEEALGLKFDQMYREYVITFGAVSSEEHELTGVCSSPRLDVAAVTKEERDLRNDLPENWYVLEQMNIDSLVIWQSSSGPVYQVVQGSEPVKIHDSFYEFIKS